MSGKMALNLLFISGKRRKFVKNSLNEDCATGFVQYYNKARLILWVTGRKLWDYSVYPN